MAGVARDLAARLGLSFTLPTLRPAGGFDGFGRHRHRPVDAPELCRGSSCASSKTSHRPSRAGCPTSRPRRHALDQQRRRRVELCDARTRPAHHPTTRTSCDPGSSSAKRVRARRWSPSTAWSASSGRRAADSAIPGSTASFATRTTRSSASLGDGGESSRSARNLDGVARSGVLHPMAIARTSKRLGLRSEPRPASSEGRSLGIDRAVERFCELVALTSHGARTRGARSTSARTCPSRSSPRPLAGSTSFSAHRSVATRCLPPRANGFGAEPTTARCS